MMSKSLDKKQYVATHDEICDQALSHYQRISTEASSWTTTIPKAIECYRKYGTKSLINQNQEKKELLERMIKDAIKVKSDGTKQMVKEGYKSSMIVAYKCGVSDIIIDIISKEKEKL